jgi:hypothetical protein
MITKSQLLSNGKAWTVDDGILHSTMNIFRVFLPVDKIKILRQPQNMIDGSLKILLTRYTFFVLQVTLDGVSC